MGGGRGGVDSHPSWWWGVRPHTRPSCTSLCVRVCMCVCLLVLVSIWLFFVQPLSLRGRPPGVTEIKENLWFPLSLPKNLDQKLTSPHKRGSPRTPWGSRPDPPPLPPLQGGGGSSQLLFPACAVQPHPKENPCCVPGRSGPGTATCQHGVFVGCRAKGPPPSTSCSMPAVASSHAVSRRHHWSAPRGG